MGQSGGVTSLVLADAKAIEEMIFGKLEDTLIEPLNVRGTQGHISAAGVSVSRLTALPAIDIEISIRSLDWPTAISMRLRYANAV